MKKFWKYFLIILLFLLGIGFVGLAYLFFFPNSSLFGLKYVSFNQHYLSKSSYSVTNVNTIELNNMFYDIEIVPTDTNKIYLDCYSNTLGFVLSKNSKVEISSSLNAGKVTFDVAEPHGFAIHNASLITLYIPKNASLSYNLNSKKADIFINKALKVNNLSYSTQSGSLNFKKGSISGNIDLNINNATFNLGENVSTSKNNTTLKMKNGKFVATDALLGNVEIKSNFTGNIFLNSCENFINNVSTCGGNIQANYIKILTMNSSDTNVYVKKTDSANINLSKFGKVNIDEVTNFARIKTNSGKIYVKTCSAQNPSFETKSGNLTITDCKYDTNVTTGSGKINVSFLESTASYSSNNKSRFVSCVLGDGSATLNGIERLNLEIKGKGSANIKMHDVLGESLVNLKKGSANFVISNEATVKYKLITKAETGPVSVNLSRVSQNDSYTTKSLTETLVNSAPVGTPNILNITSSSGAIKVRSLDLIDY